MSKSPSDYGTVRHGGRASQLFKPRVVTYDSRIAHEKHCSWCGELFEGTNKCCSSACAEAKVAENQAKLTKRNRHGFRVAQYRKAMRLQKRGELDREALPEWLKGTGTND